MDELLQGIILFIGSIVMYNIGKYNRLQIEKDKYYTQNNDKKTPSENLEKEPNLFEKLFTEDSHFANSNISPELYCIETHEKTDKLKPYEDEWKKRILLQHTKQGNITMHYDIYRQAFAYFSDMQVNYKTLSLCAMRYVRIFLCRDFFVDTNYLPKDFKSPFNNMKKEEEKKEKEKKRQKIKEKKLNFDTSVFVKKKTNDNEKKKIDVAEEDTFKNNFRYLGKISNWNPIQKYEIKKENNTISKDYDYITFKNKTKFKTKIFSELFG